MSRSFLEFAALPGSSFIGIDFNASSTLYDAYSYIISSTIYIRAAKIY